MHTRIHNTTGASAQADNDHVIIYA